MFCESAGITVSAWKFEAVCKGCRGGLPISAHPTPSTGKIGAYQAVSAQPLHHKILLGNPQHGRLHPKLFNADRRLEAHHT